MDIEFQRTEWAGGGLRRREMGQIGPLVRTEVKRIVRHAGISPVMSRRKPGEDLVATLVDLVAR